MTYDFTETEEDLGLDMVTVHEAIEDCMADVVRLDRSITVMESLKSKGDEKAIRQAMHLNHVLRQNIGRHYDLEAPTFVVESYGTPVLALEEMVEESKGIVRRMIDAVIKALEWLWEKITGLFSKGETKEQKQEKADELTKKVEEATKAGTKPVEVIKEKWAAACFGPLASGNSITINQIYPWIDQAAADIRSLSVLINNISKNLRDAGNEASKYQEGATPEEVAASAKAFTEKLEAEIAQQVKGKITNEISGKFPIEKIVAALVPEKTHCFEPIPHSAGAMLAIFGISKEGKMKTSMTNYKPPKDAMLEVKLATSIDGGIGELAKKAEVLMLAIGSMNEDMHSKLSTIKSDANALTAKLKDIKAKAEGGKISPELVKSFVATVNSVGSVQATLVNMAAKCATADKCYIDLVSAAFGAKPEEKKEEKPGDAKPAEAKPEENKP